MPDLDAVYAKTSAGLEEVRNRALALTRTQRTLLILIDGRRRLAALIAALGASGEDPLAAANALLGHALIEPAAEAGAAAHAGGVPQEPRAVLIAAANDAFGPRATAVVRKLEGAGGSTAELLAAAEAAAKLAKLTIDERQAAAFLAVARRVLSRGSE